MSVVAAQIGSCKCCFVLLSNRNERSPTPSINCQNRDGGRRRWGGILPVCAVMAWTFIFLIGLIACISALETTWLRRDMRAVQRRLDSLERNDLEL